MTKCCERDCLHSEKIPILTLQRAGFHSSQLIHQLDNNSEFFNSFLISEIRDQVIR